jgi:hypothetical protein
MYTPWWQRLSKPTLEERFELRKFKSGGPVKRYGFKYGGSWADWQTNYSDQMTFEEYLQDDSIVKKPHFLDRKADGGRIGFKDKPLKNFKTVKVTQPSAWSDDLMTFEKKVYVDVDPIPAEMETWFKETYPGKKWENLKGYERSNAKNKFKRDLVRQESQKKKTFTGTDADIANKLGIKHQSWLSAKSGNSPVYQRVIESIGEPQLIAEGPGYKTSYWDIDKLDEDRIKYIKFKKQPDRGGEGTKVLNNKELKKKFINAYKQGYGGANILQVIDPKNTLGVNQEKYGSKVLSQLIADKEVSIREGGSKSQEIYWETKREPVDLEITKLNKFYTPGMSLEKVTARLYPGWTPIKEGDSLAVVKDKTDKLRAASMRVSDYKAWLQGNRPGSTVLDNIELPKNKKEIIKSIDANSDPRFKKYQLATERRYKFYQLDKLNNKPFGYYEGLNKKIFNEFKKFNLNYEIEHGTSLSQSVKKKIPWTSKFVTFMKSKYNTQKIPLDMHGESGILKAYDVLEDKNLTFEEKKNHKDVKAYNKAANEYMLKTGNKIPTFSFNEKDVLKLLNDPNIDNQTKRQIKNSFTKQGWTLVNPGDQIETVVKFIKENGKDIPKNRKQVIISGLRNNIVNFFNKAPIPKGVKLPVGATAAALDFAIFNGLMGMPAPEAALGSMQWLLKNPEAAQKIGYAVNAVVDGKMTLDQFFDENAQELGGVFKDLIGLQMPTKVSEDDPVFTERMIEMDEAMKVPERKASGGLSGVDQYILNRYR